MMCVFAVTVVLGLSVFAPSALAFLHNASTHGLNGSPTRRAPSTVGSVIAVHADGPLSRIAVRLTDGGVGAFLMRGGSRLTADDGRNLAAGRLLPGDRLIRYADGSLRDTSQVTKSVTGVVASAPEVDMQTMILQVSGGLSIVVDIDPGTHASGPLQRGFSLGTIEEADMVRVHGVLDSTLGEMTQTDAIEWLAP
ncbi:MAG: hypothetical protein DLM70_11450 [Chloroflexi bacterium]|nr:MAG: hypothetical protein DLM70_11450 [Chloroflexota bacterium]